MANELEYIISKYIENSEIYYYGEQAKEFNEFMNFINSSVKTFDHPDGFCEYDNKVLIIEHFEFDSSNNNRKGSENRKEIARIDRKLSNINAFDTILCNYSMNNYINNFKKVFNSHYNEIDKYIEDLRNENIIKTNTDVKISFFIEDITTLGNYSSDGKTIMLLHCDKFLDLIEKSPKIDYIISLSSYGCKNCVFFMHKNFISEYRKHQFMAENTEIINLTPHVKSFNFSFPSN